MAKRRIKKFNGSEGSWVKDYIPAQVRTFAETVGGKRTPITEKDFTADELKQIRNAIDASRQRQAKINTPEFQQSVEKARKQLAGNPKALAQLEKNSKIDQTVGYKDYGAGERVLQDYNLGGSGAIRNTLGRFAYEKDPQGHLIAKDTYDFKDDLVKEAGVRPSADYEKMGTLGKIETLAADTLTAGPFKGLSTLPSRVGSAFIGKDGRPVRVDLGEANFKKGGKVKAKPKTPARSTASKRGDGCAVKGHTKGKFK